MPDKPFVRQQMSDDALQKTLRKKKRFAFKNEMKKRIMSILSQRHDYYELYNTTKKLYNMETLKEKLEEFANSKLLAFSKNTKEAEEKLQEEFSRLAPFFISGGYIKVREDYRVYPTTVEFYFHSEKEDGIKDPIVYHRDNNKVQGKIPYFPLMTLHAHDSGYDITFENEKEQYRASVLIREYQVWDEKHEYWLKWGAEEIQRPSGEKEKQFKFRKYKDSDKTPINNQVLYLKYILNSFEIGGCSSIDWINASTLLKIGSGIKLGTQRKGVNKYNELGERLERVKDGRSWSFSRKEPILIP